MDFGPLGRIRMPMRRLLLQGALQHQLFPLLHLPRRLLLLVLLLALLARAHVGTSTPSPSGAWPRTIIPEQHALELLRSVKVTTTLLLLHLGCAATFCHGDSYPCDGQGQDYYHQQEVSTQMSPPKASSSVVFTSAPKA